VTWFERHFGFHGSSVLFGILLAAIVAIGVIVWLLNYLGW
jgi:hypothetical protein